jgi:hypothetical protein
VVRSRMANGAPYLLRVARALRVARLEAILVGNAGAAIQGAPVSTLDFDFLIRDTPRTEAKIRAFGRALSASGSHGRRRRGWIS